MNDIKKEITNAKDFLGKDVQVKIDRPLHSSHPKHGFEYKLNYGFVPDTISPDGEELDVYVLGVTEPIETFAGVCIAYIHRTNDDDDKLIVVPQDYLDVSDEDIQTQTYFQEQFFESVIVR